MSKKKVLVIGGTGIAGQFITEYLLRYHDICELFIASRGIHKISEEKYGAQNEAYKTIY